MHQIRRFYIYIRYHFSQAGLYAFGEDVGIPLFLVSVWDFTVRRPETHVFIHGSNKNDGMGWVEKLSYIVSSCNGNGGEG